MATTRSVSVRSGSTNNQPLYTYSGDTAAGQANGQGLGGIWFAETASGTVASSSPSSSGGGGYYHP